MRQIIQAPTYEDFRAGAEKLHDLLDGKFVIPDAIGVLLVGVLSAVAPVGILILLSGLEMCI